MVNNMNQYPLLCLRKPTKFIGRGQRKLSNTRLWDIRKFHTHVIVLSVGQLQLAGFLRGWGWNNSSSSDSFPVNTVASSLKSGDELVLLVSQLHLSISNA